MPHKSAIFSFTRSGALLAEKLVQIWGKEQTVHAAMKRIGNEDAPSLAETVAEAWRENDTLLFIGAAGIAVRAIAPHICDKQTDPAVLVLDEEGSFVIPLLSGHLGGANEKAREIAQIFSAVPIITTATDRRGAFAVDEFAKEQQLGIRNKAGIAAVSAKALEGKPITLSIEKFPPQGRVDVLVTEGGSALPKPPVLEKGTIVLTTRRVVLGVGCRKGKSAEELLSFAETILAKANLLPSDLAAIASIQNKAEEPGIRALSRHWHIPYLTFDADLLAQVEGITASSSFVEKTVGVDNVCERSALLAAGKDALLLLPKQIQEGMTMALAERKDHV